ncbi:MAG: EamA family transporter [Candidatus Cloacimonetes bacterium HGW-Cloacimonetes-2]|jgi:drug/metabolite transporter (DMT)-like permease|nr:MAG: EamA family transporter [Candidatus Cloacimonetes bacterium HGW-Cloacimonetes-2]
MLKNQTKAYIYTGLTIAAWSTVSTAFKISLRTFSPAGLLLIASVSSLLILALIMLFYTKPRRISIKEVFTDLYKSLLPGLLNPLLYYLVLLNAYNVLRAQEAQVLNYTWAIVLSVFSIIFLKQKFRIRDLIALTFSLIGVVIIATRGAVTELRFDNLTGSALALGSSIIWAAYWIINLKDSREPIKKLYFNFLIGSLFLILYILIGRIPLLQTGAAISTMPLLAGIYVGCFEMGITFFLWFKALSLSDNTAKISNLIFVTPFISLIFIGLLLKESIAPATIIGLILIVVSNIYQKAARAQSSVS